MEYVLSERVKTLKPSAIREIFKYAADPTVVSLSAGNPAPEAFPVQEIAEISNKILTETPIAALQYSVTEGYPPLRKAVGDYMKKTYNVGTDRDELIITSGAQQVMDLLTKSTVNEGDTVICEAPSFIGSLNSFRSYNAHLCGIPLESDGMNIECLEKALQTEKNVRFIYIIANFQNPSGVTTSWEKRQKIYELAKKYNVMILEDNPYGELRISGENIPPIKSLDQDGIVAYVGSFSKILSPGMRLGYVIAPKEIVQKMVVCKQGEDVHTNIWAQMVAEKFMTEYDFNGHLENLRTVYRKKAHFCMDLLDKYLVPNKITYQPIEGGLFIWCRLPDGVNMVDFCKQAVLRKVCVVPGNAFLTDEAEQCSSFRINFSTPTDEQLEKGIKILGELAKEIL
ncbi:MAG: PLP-dependent aminotransferase family protein [Clostridia bacterium]|nr:PLP-dependent aminotransferase family protein [Clostridia bacterium]